MAIKSKVSKKPIRKPKHRKKPLQVKTEKALQRSPKVRNQSDYYIVLTAKRRLKSHYNLSEIQLKHCLKKAMRYNGSLQKNFACLLELRLDSVIRSCFSVTINYAGQLVNHKHVLVNGFVVNIKSYYCKAGDIISISGGLNLEPSGLFFSLESPRHIKYISRYEYQVVGLPAVDDIIDELYLPLIVEYYFGRC